MPVHQLRFKTAQKSGRLQRQLIRCLPLLVVGGVLASGACSPKPDSELTRIALKYAAEKSAMEKCRREPSGSMEVCSLKNPDFLKYFNTERRENAPLNSLATITNLPYAAMARFLGLKSGDTVNIVYPAAGTHIAVLQLGLMLQQMADVGISYTFTELKSNANQTLIRFANLLVAPYVVQKNFRQDGDGATFELEVFGKTATVRYVFVDKNDSLPMRVPHDIALEASIFFMHDSMDGCNPREYCNLESFALGGVYAAVSGKPKIIINEDVAHALAKDHPKYHPKSAYDILPQYGRSQGLLTVPGDYGCSNYRLNSDGAVVYFPDAGAYQRMMSSPQSLRRFNAALDTLASGSGFIGFMVGAARETYSGKVSRDGPVHVSHFESAVREIRAKRHSQ